MFALILSLVLFDGASNPLDYARGELKKLAPTQHARVAFQIVPKLGKEGYELVPERNGMTIRGGDPVGVMYGALEFGDRLRIRGDDAWLEHNSGKPFLKDRGLNLFLTLPWDNAKNDTDYSEQALVDPSRWWFQNEDYWVTLLDLMAKSRLNWLDIHGAWDISVTDAPNLYAYFVNSKTYSKVGLRDAVKARNLAQLNHVIELAHARGIRVSLMSYQASLRIPQNPSPPYTLDEKTTYAYTKEVVEAMIRQAPGLDAIGYRIGESGKSESFFRCYGEAVMASGKPIPLITRSWITTKQQVLPLARASKDFTVEIKYNGEQWGTPYMVAGGRVANWYSYAFEDYLSDSGSDKAAKMWPSNARGSNGITSSWDQGGTWPGEPYKIVWQVRANGTHRVWPIYAPDWVRRSILEMRIGTASGFTIEGLDAYYPKRTDSYLVDPSKTEFTWAHQRDALNWMTWGRLGYNPDEQPALLQEIANDWVGDSKLREAWERASVLLPKAFMAYSLGPDHRSHAPEMEWGGDTYAYASGQGFDTFAVSPINETLANLATGGKDSRYTLPEVAAELEAEADKAESLLNEVKPGSKTEAEVAGYVRMMVARARYSVGRFRSAWVWAATGGKMTMRGLDAMQRAAEAHKVLAENTWFRPLTEKLRMRTNFFDWKGQQKLIEAELGKLKMLPVVADPIAEPTLQRNASVRFAPKATPDGQVDIAGLHGAKRAWLLRKPLPSSTYFHREMVDSDRIRNSVFGMHLAAEIETASGSLVRVPDPFETAAFYAIPPLAGPAPQIYNASEAMTYLNPDKFHVEKYGGMLIGTRAWGFFGRFDKGTKAKVLDLVKQGLRLVILQQDFNKYKLDFLPEPPAILNEPEDRFDPGGRLGLHGAEAPGMVWQKFKGNRTWEVFGNGALARAKIGLGEVWVTSARLMQNIHLVDVAKDFVTLLSLGGHAKPTILIDSCSEGADFSSSCHPDLLNSHEIPFLTLGEAIAEEQGMDSFKPVPAKVEAGNILQGKGTQMANTFLRNQVIALSKRPVPKPKDFEKVRKKRKAELFNTLGLNPMPPKTPLNARITGVIERPGYRIEKLLFESRPKFYVTAYVYKSTTVAPGKLPVIVNVNGHWAHKKGEDRLQLRCAFQALQGYLAIAIDSPGHSFEGDSLIERRPEGDHNDWALFTGGLNATGVYVWDAIRALDYVATRPDADMDRIGLTGASGGGLATLYTFAADDRYKAAVPVVYMASLELAPDNGCLCNHVPGTCQIGDRSDVIAIQAPKPVYIMGAQNDGEFPPDATNLTVEKVRQTWDLWPGGVENVQGQIFSGPHDYNQQMREAMIGFFNRHLRGIGNGSPLAQPPIQTFDPEDRSFLVLDQPIAGERTLRDLALERLEKGPKDFSVERLIKVNGGRPSLVKPQFEELGRSGPWALGTLESEPGLIAPVQLSAKSGSRNLNIYVGESWPDVDSVPGSDDLRISLIGTGETAGVEARYPVYAGRSLMYTAAFQIIQAARAFGKGKTVKVRSYDPYSDVAVTYARLLEPKLFEVFVADELPAWQTLFDPSYRRVNKTPLNPALMIQPRANLIGTLEDAYRKAGIQRDVSSKSYMSMQESVDEHPDKRRRAAH